MADIVGVGSRDFLLGFRLAGLKRTYASEEVPPAGVFASLLDAKEPGVVVTDVQTVEGLDAKLKRRIRESVLPVVVILGEKDEGEGSLRQAVKSVMGVDILGAENK